VRTGRIFLPLAAVAATLFSASCNHKSEAAKEAKPAPAEYKVKMQTTKGDVVILVHRDWAPIGADHFYELVKMGFYNNNAFFRTVPGFIVQLGMNGDPKVNKDWSEITIKDDPPKVSNKIGTVVFAQTSEPNSRTTQLFINLGDNSKSLDPQNFTPFGEVVQGMDNVMNINMEYREQPDQGAIGENGNAYLEEHFPRLDYVKKAIIVP
jgi:peptidyl-prolyl cis-trans isomerase A (cyclophilin A)